MVRLRSLSLPFVAFGAVLAGCGEEEAPSPPLEVTAGNASSAGAAGQTTTGGTTAGRGGSSAVGGVAGSSTAGSAGGGASAGAAGAGSGGAVTNGGGSDDNVGGGGAAGSGGSTGGAGAAPLVAVTVYLAGDSTVSTYADTASPNDQAGWGQMLEEFLNPLAHVENRAIGGRTSRRFIDEGRLQELADELRAGDYLLVQFGTNDSNKTATYTLAGQTVPYYLDPATDFKAYLKQYISAARGKQAHPVLVTPPPRNSAYCTGGNGTGAYAQAMRELAAAEQVAVADLNQRAVAYLQAICPAPTPEDFFLRRADGTVDGTHFQENGARKLAAFVVQGLSDTPSTLARYAK